MNPKQIEQMNFNEGAVWDMLQTARGKSNAISREALAEALNISDRKIREIVAALIVDWGTIIISDYRSGGYYLPSCESEIETYIHNLHSHGVSILKREAAIKKIDLAELLAEYQMELPLEVS
ncbi:MAG: hypothetical protein G3M70_07140 [Candidatus Nitronauta litoralis]|uniref:Helix-turn-helix type 11 domain-containing protein n=1 Tax=Candidatus Nitronauta litoralis TaxID=2705533 RepID=A0A7T0BVM2_9BACT|nr:MAG: hypothetical protein G3M70_07140 [Candidatus Nitronauta litoralis]